MEYRENRDARRPFLSTPDSRVYFPAAAIEEARRSTARCLRRNEGVALVVGATGTGKTLLTRVLAAEFEAESLVAVVSPTRRIDAKSFWQQFLFGLRQTFCGCDETELRLMALDYLERSQRRRCVLLIDDAQNLPFRVFDELRSFVDQGAAASSQICVALFGTSVLEERLNLPPLYPFQQRIVSRSYLDAFESAEIADYIDCETRRVAGKFVFTSDAKRKVADFCKGSPRVANQLCDRALFLTAQENGKLVDFEEQNDFNDSLSALERIATESVEIRTIDAPLVERAWAHLLNLPIEPPKSKANNAASDWGDVVEFGTLEDDEEDNGGFNDFNASENAEKIDYNECFERVEVDLGNGGAETNDNAAWEDDVNDESDALDDEEFDEELSDETLGGEIDADLEARLLQNLKSWESAKEESSVDEEEKAENAEASETCRGDGWERADALKEKERSEIAGDEGIGEVSASLPENLTDSVDKTGEFSEINVETAEMNGQKAEERVFEALKS
ncbi:MAG: AAA family ATPase [Thermoguttaceae bacterium]|nr:AAA family ATPase [Thermoguttaceae bacterium]